MLFEYHKIDHDYQKSRRQKFRRQKFRRQKFRRKKSRRQKFRRKLVDNILMTLKSVEIVVSQHERKRLLRETLTVYEILHA